MLLAASSHAPGGGYWCRPTAASALAGGPGQKLTLLIAVDEVDGATRTVAQAVFRAGENTRGYPVLLEGLVRQWGGSCATIPPCLHCRQAITAKGVVQWCRTVRRPCPHCGKPQ